MDELLDRLMDEIPAVASVVAGSPDPRSAQTQPAVHLNGAIQKVGYSHKAMSDLLIAQPMISQNDLAARFGYTASWICSILASDAFQVYHQERLKEFVDPVLRRTVETNFEAIIMRSQEILLEKIQGPANTIPDNLALRAMELASRARGYGVRDTGPVVNVNLDLENLAGNLTALLQRKKLEAHTYEGEVLNDNPNHAKA